MPPSGAPSGCRGAGARRLAAAAGGGAGRRRRLRLTGGLHLDGLADTADGLFAHVPAKGRLEIMADPRSARFAAVALGVALLTRAAALAALEPSPAAARRALLLVPFGHGRGQPVAALCPRRRPGHCLSARADAHRRPTAPRSRGCAGAGAAVALASGHAVAGRRGAAAVVAGWAAAARCPGIARRRLGGFTGRRARCGRRYLRDAGLVVAAEASCRG